MRRFEIVKDSATLRMVAKNTGLRFHPKFKYCDAGDNHYQYIVNGRLFYLKYLDGCFKPFLFEYHGLVAVNRETDEIAFPIEKWQSEKIDMTKYRVSSVGKEIA